MAEFLNFETPIINIDNQILEIDGSVSFKPSRIKNDLKSTTSGNLYITKDTSMQYFELQVKLQPTNVNLEVIKNIDNNPSVYNGTITNADTGTNIALTEIIISGEYEFTGDGTPTTITLCGKDTFLKS